MKKQILLILSFSLFSLHVFAQKNINNYKYIVVPTSYSFLGEEDRYQLNSLTKFLFNKYGFTALFQNEEFPNDLKRNRCLATFVKVENEKGFLRTKLRIDLLDCNGDLVMSSRVGATNEKEFAKAYNLALRDAFVTYQTLGYKYEPLKEDKAESVEPMPSQTKSASVEDKAITPIEPEAKPIKKDVASVAVAVETTKMITSGPQNAIEETNIELVEEAKETLYAQPIANGYQVVDTTPKIVMILLKTAQSNVFIVKDQDAIVYNEEGKWFISKNNGDKVLIEPLNIKF